MEDDKLEKAFFLKSITISLNDYLELPKLGLIRVNNKTIGQLQKDLASHYEEYILSPVVKISLEQAKTIAVNIIGQIGGSGSNGPGVYYADDGNIASKRILSFIQRAGGFTPDADISNVIVKRSEKNITLNLIANTQHVHDLSQNIILQDNDTVIVYGTINKIYILGAVKFPGSYNFNDGAKLMDYLAQAGGIASSAGDEIGIITNLKEKNNLHKIPLVPEIKLPISDIQITPGTIIFVPTGFFSNWEFLLRQLQNLRDTLYYPATITDAIRNQGVLSQ
jgi:polysaccharide biosynthesis/export protein